VEEELHGFKICKLSVAKAEVPFDLYLANKDDIIALSISSKLFPDSVKLLAGESTAPLLIESAPFKKAMKLLPPPEDMMSFFNISGIFEPMLGFVKAKLEREVEHDPEAKMAISLMSKVVDLLDIFEGIAAVEVTEGYKTYTYELALTKPGMEETPLGKIFANQKPIKKFDRFVPKEAVSFSVGSMPDFKALYHFVMDFIKTEVPEGEKAMAQWEKIQAEIGFNADKDLLNWLGTQYVSVSMAPADPSPMGGGEGVFFLHVKDPETAMAQIQRGLDALSGFMKQVEQPIIIQDVMIEGASGFKSVTHPMIMAFFKLVIGVHEGHLIMGTSADAINSCLATSQGKHPSIVKNDRFIKEGLKPTENMYSISFTDQSGLAEEMGGLIQGLSMGVSMASAFMAAEEPEAAQIVQSIGGMLAKLGPIVAEIDFYLSTSSVMKCGEGYTMTKKVTNYREPKKEDV
jgi:hypothetical protein